MYTEGSSLGGATSSAESQENPPTASVLIEKIGLTGEFPVGVHHVFSRRWMNPGFLEWHRDCGSKSLEGNPIFFEIPSVIERSKNGSNVFVDGANVLGFVRTLVFVLVQCVREPRQFRKIRLDFLQSGCFIRWLCGMLSFLVREDRNITSKQFDEIMNDGQLTDFPQIKGWINALSEGASEEGKRPRVFSVGLVPP